MVIVFYFYTIVHGGWTHWTEWTECTCEDVAPTKQKSRSCSSPQQSGNGRHCDGADIVRKPCASECTGNTIWHCLRYIN